MTLPESGFITMDQVLQLLPVSRATLHRYIKSGKFPASIKLGRLALWKVDDIRSWMAKTH
jgi:predicted DNA-binding transcriptional regulator AlpA